MPKAIVQICHCFLAS